jgi:hypothetical protein
VLKADHWRRTVLPELTISESSISEFFESGWGGVMRIGLRNGLRLGVGFATGEQGDRGARECGGGAVAEKQTPAGNNEAGLAHDLPPRKLRFNENLLGA